MAAIFYKWLIIVAVFFSVGEGGGSSAPALPSFQMASLPLGILHPFYISVTEINYNENAKSVEISCKIFTDDLETVLKKRYHTKTDLFSLKDKELAGRHIGEYINDHLTIKIDGRRLSPKFLGFERENEAIWSYLEAANTPMPRTVEVVNNMLYDSFDEQIHLIHITVKGKRKSGKLVYPEDNLKFEF